jgi:type II secretory pathway component PulF
LTGRIQSWWWKGTPPQNPLDPKMAAHVEGMLAQAADLQRTAELEAHRIKRDAIEVASRMLARVEAAEVELQEALETLADGKQALRDGIAEELARIDGAAPVARLVAAS